jgi:hypothetical protein
MADELQGDRIQLNPDVPYPPFPIWMRVPSGWPQLDSNPGTWQRSAQNLINTAWRGSHLSAKERRDVLALIEGLVADCQRAGAALSLITVGRLPAGGAASFGMHLAFAGDGRPASLGRVHDTLPRTGVVTGIPTNSGPAVLHRDRTTMVVPGTAAIAALTSLQIFVPLPHTGWTVVLSTASAFPELTDALESMLRSMAESISIDAHPTCPTDSGDDTAGTAEYQAAPTSRGPGFERGFGTMVVRRIGPRDGDGDGAADPGKAG